jgi:cyclopropane fatty-acyl-phospholipid synthase-like methyltransferase
MNDPKIPTGYDAAVLAQSYDAAVETRDSNPPDPWKLDELAGFLNRLPAGSSVLDLGSGPGTLAVVMRDAGMDVTAVDLSPANVAACRSKGFDAEVVDFMSGTLGGPFDAIVAMNTLLHVPKASLADVFQRISDALGSGGLVFVSVYGGKSGEGVWSDDTYRPRRFFATYDDDEFRGIQTPGLSKIDVRILDDATPGAVNHPQVMLLVKDRTDG